MKEVSISGVAYIILLYGVSNFWGVNYSPHEIFWNQPPIWFPFKQDYTSVDGSPLPRCNQETHFSASSSPRGRARCPAEHVVNPNNVFRIIQNIDLQKETAYQSAVQVKPQHVSLKLRISE